MPKGIQINCAYIPTKRPMAFIKELDKLFSKYETEKGDAYLDWDLEVD